MMKYAETVRRVARVRGGTLFEVLSVVAILAMGAGGVAAFALPKFREAQRQQAETGARIVRTAIQQWQAANNESTCPTISQLVQEKHLDPGQSTNDPWGQPYVLGCSDDDVQVDRKSTRLNSSHVKISYAVFCL